MLTMTQWLEYTLSYLCIALNYNSLIVYTDIYEIQKP